MKKLIKNKKIIFIFLVCISLIATILFRGTLAELLENDVEVEPDSELKYYLSVKYDGVDVRGVYSSDASIAEVNSSNIFVTDIIPDGLEFVGFETTADGTFGAVERGNELRPCLGEVVDDTNEATNAGVWNNNHTEYTYHGLHYDATTRKVSFTVKNLKAGCVLNVGIITQTPATVDNPLTQTVETRRDFYNYGVIRENAITVYSNMVHAYMGIADPTLHSVTYTYSDNVATAPSLPPTTYFTAGTSVTVMDDLYALGYSFDGWTSSDVTISNGSFTMTNSDVVISGSFTSTDPNTVTYSISGTVPSGYIVPSAKDYYPDVTVKLDSLKAGDVFNGYRFLGWTSNDVDISSDNDFIMPDDDVSIVGSFERVKYKVTYLFSGDTKPDNSASLLPQEIEYYPGDTVSLATVNNVSGYKFLGWDIDSSFSMPDHDVVIYGTWQRQLGTFEPVITNELIREKDYYRLGDLAEFRATITNNSSITLNNIVLTYSNLDIYFLISYDFYYDQDKGLIFIDSLDPGESIEIVYNYGLLPTDNQNIVNTIDLYSVSNGSNYTLVDKNYAVTATAMIKSKINICESVDGSDVGNIFQIKVSNNNFESWLYLSRDECGTVYVDPGSYRIYELVPQEYEIKQITGDISTNGATLNVVQGNHYNITLVNRFRKKGFLHSFGHIINSISQQANIDPGGGWILGD